MALEFGRYQLLRKIASGGMGQIYLARAAGERGFEKLLVIKRILPHLVEDEEFFHMFFDEARVSARLNHPNVVQIFDLGEVNGSYYLAMEYVPGDDLRRVQKQARHTKRPIPLGAICRIVADAAAGLDYAHKAKDAQGQPLNIVHRDVSPQNVLVGFDGGVKLIDFGVAKAMGRSQKTATGVLKGKYAYMSPEQADGLAIDHRSDIFALGVVFWESLTHKRLFKDENDVATMRRVRECQVPLPSEVNPELPKELDPLVLGALHKDAAQRYPDAMALRLEIEDFVVRQRLPASSAHLVAYLSELYAERIAAEADPAWLDQLQPDEEMDLPGTPTRRKNDSTHAKDSVRPQTAAPGGGLGTAKRERPAHSRKVFGFAAVGVLAGGVLGAALLLSGLWREVPTPPLTPAHSPPRVEPPSPPEPVVLQLLSEPLGARVEIDGQEVGQTPLSYALSASRPQTALFTKEGFEPAQATLTAASAPALTVQLKRRALGPKKPTLDIKTGR
ncbi:MAG: serine/threonine protein kinase [Myxococcota bacterium]